MPIVASVEGCSSRNKTAMTTVNTGAVFLMAAAREDPMRRMLLNNVLRPKKVVKNPATANHRKPVVFQVDRGLPRTMPRTVMIMLSAITLVMVVIRVPLSASPGRPPLRMRTFVSENPTALRNARRAPISTNLHGHLIGSGHEHKAGEPISRVAK